jgi:putative addiction module component (TIGR02574 family)
VAEGDVGDKIRAQETRIMSLEQLTRDALSLSPADRVRLADSLYDSVDECEGVPGEAAEQDWVEEIMRRREAYFRGERELIPYEQMMENLRRELGGPAA